jgi:hypothetical protein
MTVTATELLDNYRTQSSGPLEMAKLELHGIDGFDGYNITRRFEDDGNVVLGVRVERRDSENSTAVFFDRNDDASWTLSQRRTFELQDPFVAVVHDELTFGGVEIELDPDPAPGKGPWRYRTILYRGADIAALTRFVDGPWGMKDIRLVGLSGGRVGVFTRPQGGSAGRGQIGFIVADSLDAITPDLIAAAATLTGMFTPEEWGGVNDAVALDDSRIAVLGHIAQFDDLGDRHYYPFAFELNPTDLSWTTPVLLFERRDLGPGESKRPDLQDVVFPGGMVLGQNTCEIFCGVGDAEAYRVVVPSPFS